VLPTTVPAPAEAYGHAKLAAEWACLRAAAAGLDVTIVRPRTILGHGRLGIFGILFDWIADGADPIVLGDGTNRYQFVHADDLATVCVLAADHAGPAVFNAGTDRFGTMSEALSSLCAHAATGATLRSLPARPTAWAMRASASLHLTPFAPYHWLMYARSMWFDIDHVREALGWAPRWSNDEMIAQSYDWFLAHRDAADTGPSHHRRTARAGILSALKRVTRVLPRAG
jgi:nucleoside-diphosphate-sugar epimerase